MDVSREITLPVDRETAWEAVTDLDRWLTEEGTVELEPGAEGELTLPGGETRWATVEDVQLPATARARRAPPPRRRRRAIRSAAPGSSAAWTGSRRSPASARASTS